MVVKIRVLILHSPVMLCRSMMLPDQTYGELAQRHIAQDWIHKDISPKSRSDQNRTQREFRLCRLSKCMRVSPRVCYDRFQQVRVCKCTRLWRCTRVGDIYTHICISVSVCLRKTVHDGILNNSVNNTNQSSCMCVRTHRRNRPTSVESDAARHWSRA